MLLAGVETLEVYLVIVLEGTNLIADRLLNTELEGVMSLAGAETLEVYLVISNMSHICHYEDSDI